ncbi:MAG: VOC family protein [Candidatus Eremiobacteraeota bacterium]|nr:VOC family protein [Candidatus Eremiobacteraeota bacterium]MCW5866622.1 VOC family protein [Candidatus Eremiobacteraeota bacterium]
MSTVKARTQVQTYLQFNGRTEEALEFYKGALGAEVLMLMRFSDSPEPCPGEAPPADKIMHACFRIGETEMLATDGGCTASSGFQGFSLTLNLPDLASAEKAYQALSVGGQAEMPLSKTFFATAFGTLADKFGVRWALIVPA